MLSRAFLERISKKAMGSPGQAHAGQVTWDPRYWYVSRLMNNQCILECQHGDGVVCASSEPQVHISNRLLGPPYAISSPSNINLLHPPLSVASPPAQPLVLYSRQSFQLQNGICRGVPISFSPVYDQTKRPSKRSIDGPHCFSQTTPLLVLKSGRHGPTSTYVIATSSSLRIYLLCRLRRSLAAGRFRFPCVTTQPRHSQVLSSNPGRFNCECLPTLIDATTPRHRWEHG